MITIAAYHTLGKLFTSRANPQKHTLTIEKVLKMSLSTFTNTFIHNKKQLLVDVTCKMFLNKQHHGFKLMLHGHKKAAILALMYGKIHDQQRSKKQVKEMDEIIANSSSDGQVASYITQLSLMGAVGGVVNYLNFLRHIPKYTAVHIENEEEKKKHENRLRLRLFKKGAIIATGAKIMYDVVRYLTTSNLSDSLCSVNKSTEILELHLPKLTSLSSRTSPTTRKRSVSSK